MNPEAEVVAWLVLRRVHGGGVVRVGDRWCDGGRGLPEYLSAAVQELAAAGLVVLAAPDPVAEATVRASLTEAGQARYAELQELLERRGEWAESDGSPGTACAESGLVELPGSTIETAETPAGVSDSQLGVLSRQAQWALDEAAHDFPAGRVTAQRREELAASLEALAVIVRASTTTTETRCCESGGGSIPLDSDEAHPSSRAAGSSSVLMRKSWGRK